MIGIRHQREAMAIKKLAPRLVKEVVELERAS